MINVHAEPKTHVPPPLKGITKDVEWTHNGNEIYYGVIHLVRTQNIQNH